MTARKGPEWTLEGISDGSYVIWVPIPNGVSKLLAGFLRPEEENGTEGWAIYQVSDNRYGWHADAMTILPGFVDEYNRHNPFIKAGAEVEKGISEATTTQGD